VSEANNDKTLRLEEQKKTPVAQLSVGTVLNDRYKVLDIAGVGGMGTVYRAQDTNFQANRMVAIKEMISQINDPAVQNSIFSIYERESNILATLRHQAIPRIYDYFILNERAYLVMEFINGRNLDHILNETKTFLPETQIVSWALELCDVLEYLHSNKPEPVIFRDIKPGNVMINSQNHLVLVDFGIAKLFETSKKNTMVGTQGYSPPEQYRGLATPQVDLFALGATLHHLLTLKDPKLEAPFSFDERPIAAINPNVSKEFIAVIDKALQYKPEDRWQSAAEMREALISVARKTGSLVNVIGSSSFSKQSVKPNWTFECEDEIRGTPLYKEGILYLGCYDNNMYAINAADGSFKWKYPTNGGITGKPDYYKGNIYFGSEDTRIHTVSTQTGNVVWTYFTDGEIRSSPTVAQGHIFFGSDDGKLHAVQLQTGRSSWQYDVGEAIRSTPFVTDERVFFGCESGELFCLDFKGSVRWRYNSKRPVTSSPVVHQDTVFFGSLDSHLYALDVETGWLLWRSRMGRGTISSPVVEDRRVYIGSADNNLYCFDIKTSKEIWRFSAQHQVNGSPLLHQGSVYFGSVDGSIYCLDQSNGQLKWRFETQGPITGSPVAHGDEVYIGSTDKNLYAFMA